MALVIASASHGMLSRIPEMSWRGRLAVLACTVLLGGAGWFYYQGGFDYLMWAYRVPPRPAAERQFVSAIEQRMHAWAGEADGAARSDRCRGATAEFAALANPVTDWSGTVATAYRVGRSAVLTVRIGRHTLLQTSRNEAPSAVLIASGSGAYPQAVQLQSGDAVRFSGAVAQDGAACLFERNRYDGEVSAALLFDFTAIRTD
jgi:hypothetical protein